MVSKRRHISTLLAAVFVIACLLFLPVSARADDVATSGTWGTNITWKYDQETKTLTFSGSGDMVDGSYNEETGFFDNDDYPYWSLLTDVGVDHIIVGEGITSICPWAFYDFTCQSIHLPSTLKTLRTGALYRCSYKIVKIPDSVDRVDPYALDGLIVEYNGQLTLEELGCHYLNGYLEDGLLYASQEKTVLYACFTESGFVTIPDSVKTIKTGAFNENYRNLTPITVVVPDTIETVEEDGLNDVVNAIYHGSMNTIPWGAKVVNGFEEDGMVYEDDSQSTLLCCTLKDENIIIPDNVRVIGGSAFWYPKNNVTVPSTVTEVRNYAFDHAANVIYEGTLSMNGWGAIHRNKYADTNFVYENSDKKEIIGCNVYNPLLIDMVIPDGVERIARGAFQYKKIKTLRIPASVTYIGDYAFNNCMVLENVVIENVETIDSKAFKDCKILKTVEIKTGLKSLKSFCFEGCTSLESVLLPDSLNEIEVNAFGYDEGLYDIEVPASVETVAENAFFAVSNVNYKGSLDASMWNACTINGYFDGDFIYVDASKKVLTSGKGRLSGVVYVPYGVEEIGNYAFYENAISRLVLPTTVKKLGRSILYYNSTMGLDGWDSYNTLTSAAFPAGIEEIPEYTFASDSSLKTIYIPKDVTKVGFQAIDTSSLATVYYEGTAEELSKIKDASGNAMSWGNANFVYDHVHTTTVNEQAGLVSPTVKQEGYYDSYEICTECGATVRSERVTIPREICSHDGGIAVKNQTSASLTTDGYSGDEYCQICNEVTKSGDILPSIKTVTLSTTKYTYSGSTKKPTVTVKDRKGHKLVSGTDYTVSYASGRKNVGKYSVKVTFKNNYKGTKTVSFTIVPKGTTISTLTGTKAGFKASWKKQSTQTTGYQLQYSTSSRMTSAKTVTISSSKTLTKTVSKLKSKKKYYVQIRTYKTVSGIRYYSAWSKSKSVTTK